MHAVQHGRLVVHITNIPTPYRIHFCNLLRTALEERGYGFHVLYCAETEPNRQWKIDCSSMQYPYAILPGVSPRIAGAYLHVNLGVVSWLRRLRPQIMLVGGSWNMPTALLASSRFLSDRIFRVFWSEAHAGAVLHRAGPVAWLRRRCLRAYDAFAVPNEASAVFLERTLGVQPVTLALPNTVDDEFYRVARSFNREATRRQLGVPPCATVFLTVARLVESKGVRELVHAAMELPSSQHLMLVLAGDGPLRRELETAAENSGGRVRVLGHLDASQIRAWLAAADAFVLATKFDPNPLSVIEAAFAGLPLLVSSNAGNAGELVREGVSGLLIRSVDVSTIATVLRSFCELSPQERRRLGDGAASLAEAGFESSTVARSFADALLRRYHSRWN